MTNIETVDLLIECVQRAAILQPHLREEAIASARADVLRRMENCSANPPKGHKLRRYQFGGLVAEEIDRAYRKRGALQWSRHEFFGVLKEEVDELWDAIKKDEPQERLEEELVQVAAMCCRYFETRDRYREPKS